MLICAIICRKGGPKGLLNRPPIFILFGYNLPVIVTTAVATVVRTHIEEAKVFLSHILHIFTRYFALTAEKHHVKMVVKISKINK